MNMFSNSIEAIHNFGITEVNNYFFDDDTSIRQKHEDVKPYLKRVAESLFEVAMTIAKELNLDKEKTYVTFNYHWNKIKLANESDDVIIIYAHENRFDVDSLEIYINNSGGVFTQYNIRMKNPMFTGRIIKGSDIFKSNSKG